MTDYELDAIDRGILHLLQRDARNITTEEMGEAVGVSPSTIGNRINQMEAAEIIKGYHPDITYDNAGFDLHVLFYCRAPAPERTTFAERTLGIPGVVEVSEFVTTKENVLVEAVATDVDNMAEILTELTEVGLDVDRSGVLRHRKSQPFNHFKGAADESEQ